MYFYLTNCVSLDQRGAQEIENMVEAEQEISWETFFNHVDRKEVESLFPVYDWKHGERLTIEKDYAVSVYRSKWYGKDCLFICHSAIEYIFTKQ